MTRNKEIENELNRFNLDVIKASCVYTPIYTVPRSWNLSEEKALQNFLNHPFEKGPVERDVYRDLGWDDLDWKIYELMRLNIRQKWVRISQKTGVFLSTVKRHFDQKIHPKCITVHEFFPKGSNYYELLILRAKSKYERTLTEAFKELPCTNVIFPLESELILFWYHENTKEILKTLEKIEEIGVLDTYHLFNPVMHGSPD
jgi:hypothetical protein